MRNRRRILLLLAAASSSFAGGARAGDDAPGPAERAARVRAGLPAPSDAEGFTFEADIVVEDATVGTATYAARPLVEGSKTRWEAVESADVPGPDPSARRRHATRAVLEADLRMVSYERTVSGPSGPLDATRVSWTPEGRLQVVRRDGGGHETKTAEASDAAATATLSGLLLFLRHVPAAAAVYEVPIFVHGAGAVRTVRVEVSVPSAAEEAASLSASAVMEGVTVEVLLAGPARRPVRIVQRRGPGTVVFAERKAPAAGPVEAGRPAASAREAGVKFLVGVLSGDEALVSSAFHWPSLLEAEKAKSGFPGDEDALRKEVLGKIRATFRSEPRAEAERAARAAAGAATEEVDGDRVRVRFGEPWSRLGYVAKAVGGAWFVVEMRTAE